GRELVDFVDGRPLFRVTHRYLRPFERTSIGPSSKNRLGLPCDTSASSTTFPSSDDSSKSSDFFSLDKAESSRSWAASGAAKSNVRPAGVSESSTLRRSAFDVTRLT